MGAHDIESQRTPPSEWVVRFVNRIPKGGLVLDLACGRGRHTALLLELGYHVLAVDRDVSQLEALENRRLTVFETDLETGPWTFADRVFEGVVVTNYLHRPRLLSLVDLLGPGGVLIYETFTKGHEVYGRPTNPNYLLQPDELLQTFAPHLEIVAHEHHLDPPPHQALRQRLIATKGLGTSPTG